MKEKCYIIQDTSDTGMFTVFADKQNKERILGEKTLSLRTKQVPKLNRNRGPKTEVRTVPWVTCTVAPLVLSSITLQSNYCDYMITSIKKYIVTFF